MKILLDLEVGIVDTSARDFYIIQVSIILYMIRKIWKRLWVLKTWESHNNESLGHYTWRYDAGIIKLSHFLLYYHRRLVLYIRNLVFRKHTLEVECAH